MATTTTVDTQSIVAGSGGTSTPVKLTLQSGTQAVSIQLGITTTRAAVATDQSGGRREFTLYWAFSPDDLTLANVPTLLRHCAKSQSMVMNTDIETAGQRQQVRDKVNGQYLYVWFGYPGSLDAYAVVIKATELFFLSSATDPTFTTITVTGSTSTPIVTSPAATNLTLAAGGTNQSVVLTPSGTGGVGIGTITPAQKLSINGTTQWAQTDDPGYSGYLTNASTNNAYNPAITRNLIGSTGSTYTIASGDMDAYAGIQFGISGTTTNAGNISFFAASGSFATNDSVTPVARMFIANTGDVSISSTTAGSAGAGALVVTGGLATGAASYFGGDATIYGLTVGRGAGAVPTNTTVGAGAISGSNTGANNTAVGWEALKVNTSGAQNVAIGRSALAANNTGSGNNAMGVGALLANQSGSNNIAIGGDALVANLSASENTAVGYRALYSNTTGGQNTALGENALSSNTTASYNTALGRYAARLNTTGTGITAVGHQALASNTTGTANIAVGGYDSTSATYAPLYENTTGSYNVGIGVGALRSNLSASNNTAVGYQAGYTNQTGSGNTFLGYAAGNVSTGSHNTLLGRASGLALTTGVSNTFIGGYAASTGGSGAEITSGSKNTIIGAYNGNQGGLDIRTASNYIVLSDGDGNPRAYFNGSIAIFNGTISPVQATTAAAPAYVKGAIYFDTTLNKLRVGGATAYETITSV